MSTPTRIFAGVPLIDTPLVQKAIDFARHHNDTLSFNHAYRSWVFGVIIASKLPSFSDIDHEVHAVSALLHDLAWDCRTSPFVSPDKRFEVDSANAARDFLTREASHFDARQRQLVWDSIALHTTSSIARHKEPEVAVCSMGIFADFRGPQFPGGLLTKAEYNAVVAELPADGFKVGVKELMCELCEKKPETTYDNFVRDFGERFVQGYPLGKGNKVEVLIGRIDH
ncbi:hypothetical protein P170DRAFT_353150 [Aspergillus steynii IBT 23096]|uniref:HD domain-containing protein n=1 Tax=Aspergillus steynii IBT 23096 TaxID=1392250 RepID=A0A2I2GEK9_9EURO|nr:uncharacterized protein P170DRAFT_353150 [Aspergillus steynii IBT 23096]PLB51314.1 hypothetical protein P170DRAFT_353150 [Aspergillus steynii IBT 23096]